jgi:hypothetical protein
MAPSAFFILAKWIFLDKKGNTGSIERKTVYGKHLGLWAGGLIRYLKTAAK